MTKEFSAVHGEMAREFATMRVEMAAEEVSLLRWSFLFWVGQLAALSAMMAFLLRALERA